MSQNPRGSPGTSPELGFPPPAPSLLHRVRKLKIFAPLSEPNFALFSGGTAISFLGDGILFVALPWQVYELSPSPVALSMVEFAWVGTLSLFILFSGALSDRVGRRRMMIAGDAVRIVATGALGVLAIAQALELWHMVALAGLYGMGSAIYYPSYEAIAPELVPDEMLVEANSFRHFSRPFTAQLAGPAIGGLVIAAWGTGAAFLLDAASFVVSIAVVLMMKVGKAQRSDDASAFKEIADGFRFVRRYTWIWATMLSAIVALLLFHGPFEVLVPFVIKEKLGGSSTELGLAFAAGGAGAVVASIVMAQRGLPRRPVLFMYVIWTIAVGSLATYAFITEPWQGAITFFIIESTAVAGLVVWSTMLQRKVPKELRGRVMSLDWFSETALMPVGVALTGPISTSIGVEATLFGAGILAGASTIVFLLVPGVRDVENEAIDVDEAGPASEPVLV